MRIRVGFEYGAGVCLWADDAEARDRWCSAVEFTDVALPSALAVEGERLMAELDRAYEDNESVIQPRWSDAERESFAARAADWTTRVATALAPEGIAVAPYGAPPEPVDDGPEFEGCVMALFASVEARAAIDQAESASHGWGEVATWNGDIFKFRATERSPAELLAKLERSPGFVCGWWQERLGGPDAMLEGDPEDHLVACVRARNATGAANFLSWLHVQRVHLSPELAGEAWSPSAKHRLADARGSWWEWFQFTRNAAAALRGGKPSASYLRSERERLFWRWTHGGSRAGWPASMGEALERIELRRESFQRYAR